MKRPWLWMLIAAGLVGIAAMTFFNPSATLSPGPLMPAHTALEDNCFACHAPFHGAAADRCIGCHAIADIGNPTKSAGEVSSFHQGLLERNCTACHSDHGRLVERRFSHELLQPNVRNECVTCHAAPQSERHHDLGTTCNQCHTVQSWSPATFDHGGLAPERLARCEGCHRSPADPLHRQITTACARCHSSQSWTPSTFNHERSFSLDGAHRTSCATCHTDSDFTRYTCFGCHEHTLANVRAEHEEEGIRNFANCVTCHRSGDGEGDEGDD